MMTHALSTIRAQKALIALLLLFSVSLALSKTAVNIVMTLTYLTALLFAIRFKDYRTVLASHMNQPLVLPLLLYIAVTGIGVFYTENSADGMGIVNKTAGLLLVYYMTSVLIETVPENEEKHRISETLVLLFITGIMVLDIVGLLTYGGIIGDRKFSLPLYPMHVHHIWFANLNALGIYAASSFFLFGELPRHSRKRALLIAFIMLAVLSILLSTSRTAWLGMTVTSIILTYLYAGKKRIFFLTLAAVLAACLLAYQYVPLVHDRMDAGFTDISQYAAGIRQTSMGLRFLMWKASTAMFLSSPLFGVGTGDYVVTMHHYIASGAYPASLMQFNQPHNMYLFSLATNGLAGLCALLFVFYSIFKCARTRMRMDRRAGFLAFIALATGIHFMVGGLTDSFFNIQILRTAFAFLIGVSIRAMNDRDHPD